MKPTLTINLNSTVFHIDNDAYETLSSYLNEIERHFQDDERKEIMADIEARIAELFSGKLSNIKNVISIEDVNEIMSVLGTPNQFSENDSNDNYETQQKTETSKKDRRRNRKYFRDPDNAILGGVLSGLAAFLGWETTITRIAFVIAALLGYGWPIAAYFIVWIIAPKANSVAQKLEMQGEEANIENIKSYLESDQFKNSISEVGSTFMRFFNVIIKVLAVLFGIALFAVCAITIFCALVTVIVALYLYITNDPILLEAPVTPLDFFFENPIVAYSTGISVILLLAIPLIAIIIGSINLIRRNNKLTRIKLPNFIKVTSITLWVISSLIFISVFTLVLVEESKTRKPKSKVTINHTSKNFRVDNFDSIKLSAAVDLTISKGDSSRITISGYDNALDNFECESENGTLRLYRKKGSFSNSTVSVVVFKNDISSIDASAACKVTTTDTIRTENLEIDASAASLIDITAIANTIECDASAASKITIAGKCNLIDADISAASKCNIKRLDYENKKINCDISSSIKE